MSETKRMIGWMVLFLAVAALVCAVLFSPLASAFAANRIFNGLIVGVLLVGIVINFLQVLSLEPASVWISDQERGMPPQRPPRLLAPMARMLRSRGEEGFRLSAITTRSLLDGVRLRLDEARDIARYMVGLLIFLGLLGTFWGLLDTVGGVASVISGLSLGSEDMRTVFDTIKRDLQGPLAGMGTAFSSSLFGLGGALILGVLDLQAGHAQNRFYNRLEEWLSGMTHLPSTALGGETGAPLPGYIEALLEQTAEALEQIQRSMGRSEEERRALHAGLGRLTEQLTALTDQLRSEQKVALGLARNQTELQSAIATLTTQMGGAFAGYEEMRDHLRNADVALSRLVQEATLAREQIPQEMRKELRVLTQSLAREPRVKA